MQVTVENTGTLERKVRVELPDERISKEIDNRLQRLSKTTKVQGFRPGKAPLKVIKSRYGEQVRREVVGELVQSSFYEAITQEKLKPAGQPQIDELDDQSGKNLSYTATFEVYPEVKLASVDKIEVEKPVCKVTDEDMGKMIDLLRKQRRDVKAVERKSKEGDILNIDFEGFMDGVAFEGGKAEGYQLELGSGTFIAGFEDGLIGKKADEEVIVKVTFPDDYGKDELKGKPAEFKVKVNVVNEPVLPEVDAEFMENFGVKDGDKEAFNLSIRTNMEREVDITLRRQIKDAVLDKLHEANTVELPKAMVHSEAHRIHHELEENLKRQGLDARALDKTDPHLFEDQAKKRVALQLIVSEIIKQNEMKADPSRVREMIEQAAAGYQDPNAVVNWYYSDKKNLAEVEALALEEMVIDWVLKNAKVTEKACTFDEIMNKGQTAS